MSACKDDKLLLKLPISVTLGQKAEPVSQLTRHLNPSKVAILFPLPVTRCPGRDSFARDMVPSFLRDGVLLLGRTHSFRAIGSANVAAIMIGDATKNRAEAFNWVKCPVSAWEYKTAHPAVKWRHSDSRYGRVQNRHVRQRRFSFPTGLLLETCCSVVESPTRTKVAMMQSRRKRSPTIEPWED